MTADRLAQCRVRLDAIAGQSAHEHAEVLEFVHDALKAELDELLRRDRRSDEDGTTP